MSVNPPVFLAWWIVVCPFLATGRLDAAPQGAGPAPTTSHNIAANLLKSLADLPFAESDVRRTQDYLIDPTPYTARVVRSVDGRKVVLENGLIRRVWRLSPNGACVAFDNLMTDQAMLRSVRPEARLTIDGERFDVGGLIGQPNHAYL